MAAAREESGGNPYDSGLGGGVGGKFRKRPFRRAQTTPYDRPPTAARNTSRDSGNDGGGWLSRLVDPAQRLITYSAHRLFASVFRKRLEAPPQQPQQPQQEQQMPETETNQETRDADHEGGSADDMVVQVKDGGASDKASNKTNKDGFTELEQILRQKTFTRSEIDRLTSLLHSRNVDASLGNQEQRNELIYSEPLTSSGRDDEIPHNLSRENGIQNRLASTPFVSRSVLDQDIASPAELAKAYMGSRPSEVSPSMLGLRGQVVREDSVLFANRTQYPPKSSMMLLVPRSSGQVALPENGLTTPRSRGRSAVYSMARTPYSRPQSIVKAGLYLPSSQNALEEGILSGSKQGNRTGLKRRSSVLDSDVGSVGPVRRIRQKSNLLSSRSLTVPPSGSPLAIQASAAGFGFQHASSSKQEAKPSFANTSTESADNKIPGSSFNSVPSKSKEMASKILQQLDKLVSAREKSPTKLSPSMLHGRALKSLQNVDSPKLLENLEDNKLTGSPGALQSDAREPSTQKQDKLEESSQRKLFSLPDKPVSVSDIMDMTGSKKDNVAGLKDTDLSVKDVSEHPPPRKRAFRMSAYEDFVELDDDVGAESTSLAEKRDTPGDSKVRSKTSVVDAAKVEKPPALSEVKPLATYVPNGNSFHGISNGSMDTGKSPERSSAASPIATVQSSGFFIESITKFGAAATSEQSNAASAVFSFGEKASLQKEPNNISAIFAHASSFSAGSDSLDKKIDASSNTKPEKPNSFTAGTTDSLSKLPDSDKISNNTSEAGLVTSAASSPSGSIFSFGASAASSSPINGSLATSPSVFSTASHLASNPSASQSPLTTSTLSFPATPFATDEIGNSASSITSNSSSMLPSASVPSVPTTATFLKFGGSTGPAPAPVSSATGSAITAPESKETSKKDSTFGNLTGVPFGGTASFIAGSGSSIFSGTSSAITSTTSALFGGTSSATTGMTNNIIGGTSCTLGSTGNGVSSGTPAAVGSTGSSIFVVTSPTTTSPGTSMFAASSSSSSGNSIFGSPSPALTSTGGSLFGGTSSSIGSSIFGFSAGAASSASTQSQAPNPFTAATRGTGMTTSTQSIPFQFGSSTSTSSVGLSGSTSFPLSSSPFGSSISAPTFGASASQQDSSSSLANSTSSGSTLTSSIFGSNWQAPKSTPIFGSTFNSSTSSPSFSFGASSSPATPTPVFSSSASNSSSSIFTFNSSQSATPSQPMFGNSAPGFAFGAPPSTTNGNNDHMSMEDSMAEDTDQTKTSIVPTFGQPPISPPQPSFAFGAGAVPASGASAFQFGGQPNTAVAQNVSPFQASGSLEFNGGAPGGSFSLGSTGGDKSSRRIVKPSRNRRPKK